MRFTHMPHAGRIAQGPGIIQQPQACPENLRQQATSCIGLVLGWVQQLAADSQVRLWCARGKLVAGLLCMAAPEAAQQSHSASSPESNLLIRPVWAGLHDAAGTEVAGGVRGPHHPLDHLERGGLQPVV